MPLACASCGAELPPSSRFCNTCGAPVMPPGAEPRVPTHLAERILTSRAALEGERKEVTVLFADVRGSMELLADRDPEDARKILDPVLERMMDAVHRYEGTVNQVMGDGIMALFGAPLAHEDHAVRACYAALGMQDSVKRYADALRRAHGVDVQIRVGLNSGEVVVRSIGSDLRMDYSAIGQTTHLAARMEQLAAPGSIRLTGATLRLAESFIEVRPLGPIPVKGLAEPIEVYEMTGAGAARTRLDAAAKRGLTPFVGRQRELEQLRDARDAAGTGRGQVVAIVGEAGVGKSRLVYELTHAQRGHGWLTLASAAVSYGRTTSYLPVRGLLHAYFEISERDDAHEVQEKVTAKVLALDRTLAPILPALLALLDLPVDDTAWNALDAAQRQRHTVDAVKRLLLREAREQPVLLVVEDLHWIDPDTQAALETLVDSLGSARILLVVNHRPEYQHAWAGKSYYGHVRLDALPATSAANLLDALLGSDPTLTPLTRLLTRRGNPFFLEETVRTLVETNVLTGERGRYRLTQPIQAVRIPTTVQSILAARIDRLAPDDKRILEAASVVGRDVPFELLQAITDVPDDSLRGGLDRLQRAELLYEVGVFPDQQYVFTHGLTLEVAYARLLQERRRSLHERVLEALEQRAGESTQKPIEQLAHHATRAQRWDRAARYLHQAGEKAFAQGRYRAAATFCETALDALDRLGDAADTALKVDVCLELWSARISFGQYDGSRELGEKAEALARSLDDGPRLAQVQLRRAQAVAFTGAVPGPLASAIEQAREALERSAADDLRTRSYARFVVGHAARELGRIADAVTEFGAGLALFDAVTRDSGAEGLALPVYVSLGAWRAEACAALGECAAAIASAEDALRVAGEIEHASSLAAANMFRGIVHIGRGEMQTALPFLERGLALATEHDLHMGSVRAATHLGYALVVLGQRERGLELLAQAGARSATTFTAPHVTGYGALAASAYLAANRPAEARLEIERGLAAAAARNARGYRPSLLRVEADLLATEDVSGARARLHEALALAAELGMRPEIAHCHLGLARLSVADDHLECARTLYRAMGMTYWLEKLDAEFSRSRAT